MELSLPTVTADDLRLFHTNHFPDAPSPVPILWSGEQGVKASAVSEEHCYDEEDDGLGYYDDGTKRTLTDEQIAMFRHTEIQTILRERRRRLEEGEPLHKILNSQPPSNHTEALVATAARAASPAPSSDLGTPMSISSDDERPKEKTAEKPTQQWTAVSAKTKARNAKNRQKNRKNHRARKKEEKIKKEQEKREREMRAEESDEWDPWHQANGPDVQKDETIDLDY